MTVWTANARRTNRNREMISYSHYSVEFSTFYILIDFIVFVLLFLIRSKACNFRKKMTVQRRLFSSMNLNKSIDYFVPLSPEI